MENIRDKKKEEALKKILKMIINHHPMQNENIKNYIDNYGRMFNINSLEIKILKELLDLYEEIKYENVFLDLD